jgi:hypothetical protein
MRYEEGEDPKPLWFWVLMDVMVNLWWAVLLFRWLRPDLFG